MAIVKKPTTEKLFGTTAAMVIVDDCEPRVHNRHHRTAPADAIYIGRGTPWGNPYIIGQHGDREQVIELYRANILPNLNLAPLRGKHLVCSCKPAACHGDVLLAAAKI